MEPKGLRDDAQLKARKWSWRDKGAQGSREDEGPRWSNGTKGITKPRQSWRSRRPRMIRAVKWSHQSRSRREPAELGPE